MSCTTSRKEVAGAQEESSWRGCLFAELMAPLGRLLFFVSVLVARLLSATAVEGVTDEVERRHKAYVEERRLSHPRHAHGGIKSEAKNDARKVEERRSKLEHIANEAKRDSNIDPSSFQRHY